MTNDNSLADRVVGLVKRNPEGLLLLGAGIALMFRAMPKADDSPKLRRAKAAARAMKADSDEALGRVGNALHEAGDYTSEAAAKFAHNAADLGEAARRNTQRYARETQRVIKSTLRRQPMTVAVAGIAAGAGLAALLPATRMEEDVFAPAAARLSGAATEMTHSLREAATSAIDETLAENASRGETPDRSEK